MFGKHAWMCSVCGQGLTRKSSATRHNNNLHRGEAVIVRPIEYVIRRLNNQLSPPRDPLSLRRNNNSHNDKRRTMTNQIVGPNYSHENNNNNNDNNDFLINSKVGFNNGSFSKQDMGCANKQAVRRQTGIASPPTPPSLLQQQNQHVKNNDGEKISTISPLSSPLSPLSPSYAQPVIHHSLLKDQQQPLQKNTANNDNKMDKWLERNSKLEELIKLVRKNYSYEYAQKISMVVKVQLIMFEDDNFLDHILAQVRVIDRSGS